MSMPGFGLHFTGMMISFVRRTGVLTGILLFPLMLWGQYYIPFKTLAGEGDRAFLMVAAPDTAGHLLFGGVFSGVFSLGGQEITDTAGMGVFTGRVDSSGEVTSLQTVASCEGLCDLQQLLVLPGGEMVLFVSYRKDLYAGDTLFQNHGQPALALITLDAAGQYAGARLLMKRFRGRVLTTTTDSLRNIWLGGWFRKMEIAGVPYRARGKKDAFLLRVAPGERLQPFVAGGAGEQEISVLLPDSAAALRVAGTYSQELNTGKKLFRCEEGHSLFVAVCDSSGLRQPVFPARAAGLRLSGGLLTGRGSLLLGGSFSGTLVTEDTSVVSAGYEDGFLLYAGDDSSRVTQLGGVQADRVEALTADLRGRIFLAGTFGGEMISGEDTLVAGGRGRSFFLAEAGREGDILWALHPGTAGERTPAFLSGTSDLLLWTGGDGPGGNPWLASWLDPCTLLHFDLPGEKFLCAGESDTLAADPGYVSYLWTPGGVAEPALEIHDTGYYKVRITDRYGCVAEDSIHVAGDSVRLRLTVEDEVLPGGYNGTIDLTVISGLSPWTYRWNTGDVTEDLTGLQAGTYEVQVTDSAGCSATATAEVKASEATGIYDLYNYPNPFADVTRILYSLPEGAAVEISIWDVSGKKLFVLQEKNAEQGIHSFEWARKNLKDGVYYLKMRSPLGEITKKIMIISR